MRVGGPSAEKYVPHHDGGRAEPTVPADLKLEDGTSVAAHLSNIPQSEQALPGTSRVETPSPELGTCSFASLIKGKASQEALKPSPATVTAELSTAESPIPLKKPAASIVPTSPLDLLLSPGTQVNSLFEIGNGKEGIIFKITFTNAGTKYEAALKAYHPEDEEGHQITDESLKKTIASAKANAQIYEKLKVSTPSIRLLDPDLITKLKQEHLQNDFDIDPKNKLIPTLSTENALLMKYIDVKDKEALLKDITENGFTDTLFLDQLTKAFLVSLLTRHADCFRPEQAAELPETLSDFKESLDFWNKNSENILLENQEDGTVKLHIIDISQKSSIFGELSVKRNKQHRQQLSKWFELAVSAILNDDADRPSDILKLTCESIANFDEDAFVSTKKDDYIEKYEKPIILSLQKAAKDLAEQKPKDFETFLYNLDDIEFLIIKYIMQNYNHLYKTVQAHRAKTKSSETVPIQ